MRNSLAGKAFILIEHLKKVRIPLTPAQLRRATGIDLDESEELVAEMRTRALVEYERVTDTYRFRPEVRVTSKAELKDEIARSRSGVLAGKLLDAYPTAGDDIDALVAEGSVLRLKNSETKKFVLFPVDRSLMLPIDERVKKMWIETRHPDMTDVANYLKSKGHRSAQDAIDIERFKAAEANNRKRKRRAVTYTNTHLDTSVLDAQLRATEAREAELK